MRHDGHDPEWSEAPEGRLTKLKVQAHATTDGVRHPEPSFSWRSSGTAIRETTEKGDKEVGTTATPSRATTITFPLKYFVLAFAITWFFWGLAVLGARGVIPTLPGFMTGIQDRRGLSRGRPWRQAGGFRVLSVHGTVAYRMVAL